MPEPEEGESSVCPVSNSLAAHMFEKCLTWLEYQPEVNQYNTYTLRELHALQSVNKESPMKAEDLTRVTTKVNVCMSTCVCICTNVVFDCISRIRTKCLWHLTKGVQITEDSCILLALCVVGVCHIVVHSSTFKSKPDSAQKAITIPISVAFGPLEFGVLPMIAVEDKDNIFSSCLNLLTTKIIAHIQHLQH